MRRSSAGVAILILVAILALSVLDATVGQPYTLIPAALVAPAVAILSGVAIGVIIHGLTMGDRNSAPRPHEHGDPGDPGGFDQ